MKCSQQRKEVHVFNGLAIIYHIQVTFLCSNISDDQCRLDEFSITHKTLKYFLTLSLHATFNNMSILAIIFHYAGNRVLTYKHPIMHN